MPGRETRSVGGSYQQGGEAKRQREGGLAEIQRETLEQHDLRADESETHGERTERRCDADSRPEHRADRAAERSDEQQVRQENGWDEGDEEDRVRGRDAVVSEVGREEEGPVVGRRDTAIVERGGKEGPRRRERAG